MRIRAKNERNGSIVYEKDFGFLDDAETTTLPHDAMMRLASVSKPITATGLVRCPNNSGTPLGRLLHEYATLGLGGVRDRHDLSELTGP